MTRSILVIPDLHSPWHHRDAFTFLHRLKREYRPDVVVCMGDEIDAASWSRHPKNPALPGPAEELRLAVGGLRELYRLFPRALVCNSNHPERIWKQARSVGLPDDMLRSANDLFGQPEGWERADRHVIDGIVFQHGDGFTGEIAHTKAARANRMSTVIGHIHAHGGVHWMAGPFNRIFAMNVGCLIDPTAPAFNYAKFSANRPTLGAGVIYRGLPMFIPMEV